MSYQKPIAILGFNVNVMESLVQANKSFIAAVPTDFGHFMAKHGLPYVLWDYVGEPEHHAVTLGIALATYGCHWAVPLYEETVAWAGAVNSYFTGNLRYTEQYKLFRDKPTMKRRAQMQGLKVGVFQELESRLELIKFFNKVNHAAGRLQDDSKTWLHLKPKDRAGSEGHRIIKKRVDIDYLPDDIYPCLAETHLEGKECSVEAFVFAGKVKFLNITEYVHLGISRFVPASNQFERHRSALREAVESLIKGFDITHGMIHGEFFVTEEGKVSFGEVAYRVPGGHIFDLIQRAYKFDPFLAFVLCADPAAVENEVDAIFSETSHHHAYMGCLTLYPREESVYSAFPPEELLLDPAYDSHRLIVPENHKFSKDVPFGYHLGTVYFSSSTADNIRSMLHRYESLDYFFDEPRIALPYKNHHAIVKVLIKKAEQVLTSMELAAPFAKVLYQDDFFHIAKLLCYSDEGVAELHRIAPRFDAAGVFVGGDWEHLLNLRVETFMAHGGNSDFHRVVEILSMLRMLAVALESANHPYVTAQYAQEFCSQIVVQHANLLDPVKTTVATLRSEKYVLERRFIAYLATKLPGDVLQEHVAKQQHHLLCRRPLAISSLVNVSRLAAGQAIPLPCHYEKDAKYFVHHCGADFAHHLDLVSYRRAFQEADRETLGTEAEHFVSQMQDTGMASPFHAVLLRQIWRKAPELLPEALGMGEERRDKWDLHRESFQSLIKQTVYPSTAQSIWGIKRLMQRTDICDDSLLERITRIYHLDLSSSTKELLQRDRIADDGASLQAVLVSALLQCLGHPLGVSTRSLGSSQVPRGICYWAQRRPDFLISLVEQVASGQTIQFDFGGEPLVSSQQLSAAVSLQSAGEGDLDIAVMEPDPVTSLLYKPIMHIYQQMMELCWTKTEDSHGLINPALYGSEFGYQFVSIFNFGMMHQVLNHQAFIQRFYDSFCPSEGASLSTEKTNPNLPTPCGFMQCNEFGEWIGMRGILLQRVVPDREGKLRAYYYHPDLYASRELGQGVVVSCQGNGELLGENSLPLEVFAAYLYAFNFDETHQAIGCHPPVPYPRIRALAGSTWGRSFSWV